MLEVETVEVRLGSAEDACALSTSADMLWCQSVDKWAIRGKAAPYSGAMRLSKHMT